MAILPIPTVPFFDPITKEVHPQWVEFFRSIEGALPTNLPPVDARYVTTTSDPTLTNEINLGGMASGLIRSVVGAGIATLSTIPFTGLTSDFLRGDAVFAAPTAGSGDVTGPGSAVADRIATFNGATGKVIQDGGQTIADLLAAASVPLITNGGTNITATSVDTYLTGSALSVGGRVKVGTVLAWRFFIRKTAAGVVAPNFHFRFGTTGTTADTASLTLAGAAQTADADVGLCDLSAVVDSVGASGTVTGARWFTHQGTTTGLMNTAQNRVQAATSAAFATNAGTLIAGVSVDPGAAAVWTIHSVAAQATNLT